jgi:NTP pyrophosphatase (non-canonical NTP hydrolase)
MLEYSLDDLYYLVSHIYSQQNFDRHPSTTFSHFVEVCGMLTIHAREKNRLSFSIEDALCKALGWFFPLIAKFNVRSIEELVYRKYPYVCPYCRKCPHDESICKNIHGEKTVDHKSLKNFYIKNQNKKPKTLDEWQLMFQEIYPRSTYDDNSRSILGLFEEIGEFAEAFRVFDRHPKYFAGEAADVFSYLMGVANEHAIRQKVKNPDYTFSFGKEFILRYPGLCKHCGFHICVCPTIPEATVGRMSKELDIENFQNMFSLNPKKYEKKAEEISDNILNSLGGIEGILKKFPFDRGEINSALIQLCLILSDLTIIANPEVAKTFRSIALTTSSSQSLAGASFSSSEIDTALEKLKKILPEFINEIQNIPELQKPIITSVIGQLLKDNK